MKMKITKESIEECFQIIEKNGGVRAWQEMNKCTMSSTEANISINTKVSRYKFL